METPTKGFRRLAPGREVRLRHAWLLTCTGVIKNDSGDVIELRGKIDPDTLGVAAPDVDARFVARFIGSVRTMRLKGRFACMTGWCLTRLPVLGM